MTTKNALKWDYSLLVEAIWWALPCLVIIALTAITWKSSHNFVKKPLSVQVVALEWKWLFIYPEQSIATVNFLQIPEETPIHCVVTADAPMDAFWIPTLGTQCYAMPGMKTNVRLIAHDAGSFRGSGFIAKASSDGEFENWVRLVQGTSQPLTREEYKKLAFASGEHPQSYVLQDTKLFDEIVKKI